MSGFREGQGPLTIFEAEGYVSALKKLDVKDVGGDQWMTQHEMIEKLNIQAHFNALTKHDEFVVDAFVHSNKIGTLIHDLMLIEIWKEKVFPVVVEHLSDFHVMKCYVILYHEATVCNLLELLMYHQSVAEEGGDEMTELLDYCYRKLSLLVGNKYKELNDSPLGAKEKMDEKPRDTLKRQMQEIGYSTAVCAVSIVRYFTEHLPHMHVSILARAIETHDLVLSLIPLLEVKPFERFINGKVEKFVDQKWQVCPPEDRMKLTKTEGQIWLGIYNLLMERKVRDRYELNTMRKDQIILIKKHFNDVLVDQLPLLAELRRFVEELILVQPPPPTSSSLAIIEQIPEIRDNILRKVTGGDGEDDPAKWEALSASIMATVFSDDKKARERDLAKLTSTYNLDQLEEVMDDPKCALCGNLATKRCAKCQTEWYCSRECQVAAWKKYHKKICKVICGGGAKEEKA
jgi:hypothetical protein